MRLYSVFIFVFICPFLLFSRPQYSMLTGNQCISCHTLRQGSALRNELGAYARSSIIDFEGSSIAEGIEKISQFTTQFGGKLRFGADVRFQSAKLGGPSNSERDIFNMQASPYLVIHPVDWLELYGSYNFAPRVYANQSRWSAFIMIRPDFKYPELRVGQIKPSIGNQYDDHTLLIRQIAGPLRSNPILPPDYSELGAEVYYNYNKFVNFTAGIFKTDNFNKIFVNGSSLIEQNAIASLVRIALTPRLFEKTINANVGISHYFTTDFYMTNIFVHLGWTDKISFLSEYIIADSKGLLKINNYFVELLYHFLESVDFSLRYENAISDYYYNSTDKKNYKTNQYVVGLNLYLLPFIEFRPEYRIYDRDFVDGYHSQWAFQIHFYY